MHKRIETERELHTFKKFCNEFMQKNGYPKPKHTPGTTNRYFILNNDKESVGTLEIMPYNPEFFSNIECDFKFREIYDVRKYAKNTYEVGKVSILEKYQKQGYLEDIITAVIEHSIEYGAEQYISMINSVFYRALRVNFGIDMESLDERRIVERTCMDEKGKIQTGRSIVEPARLLVENLSKTEIYQKILEKKKLTSLK